MITMREGFLRPVREERFTELSKTRRCDFSLLKCVNKLGAVVGEITRVKGSVVR